MRLETRRSVGDTDCAVAPVRFAPTPKITRVGEQTAKRLLDQRMGPIEHRRAPSRAAKASMLTTFVLLFLFPPAIGFVSSRLYVLSDLAVGALYFIHIGAPLLLMPFAVAVWISCSGIRLFGPGFWATQLAFFCALVVANPFFWITIYIIFSDLSSEFTGRRYQENFVFIGYFFVVSFIVGATHYYFKCIDGSSVSLR